LDAKIEKMRPEHFYQAGKAKASEMRLKSTANRFVVGHINREIAPTTFYYKPCKQRTSRMHLNPTANRFAFGRITREIAPRTFSIKLAGRELPKCV